MKLCRFLFALIVLSAVVVAPFPAGAAQRCVFMEDFTNASCGPCASLNPGLRSMLVSMTHDTVVAIAWHVWWPGGDPMYSYNTGDVTTRTNYYGVASLGVPHVRVDGIWNTTGYSGNTVNLIRTQIRSRYNNNTSPCTIEFSAFATGETGVHVMGTVNAESDMLSPNLRLFAALITDTIQYGSPPGSNGETLFPDVFRDVWPSATGQSFTLNAGGSYDFDGTMIRAAAWPVEDLSVVVWVQDYSSRDVLQASITPLNQNYGLITASASARQLIWPMNGGEVSYQVDLTNVGALDDVYDVNLEGTFPEGWSHSVEASGIPADPAHIQVPVTSQETVQLTVRMNPNGNPGSLPFTVHVTTPNEPLIDGTESFVLMSGLDIVLVDDDIGGNRETWYLDALQATAGNLLCGRWDMNVNSLDAASLEGVDAVIWFTGDGFIDGTTLTAEDQTMLASYLDQGGRLFLSGQGIGFDIRTDPFFANYIHGIYRQNYPGHFDLTEVAGDPIGNGLEFMISGGDGANNQTRQSSTLTDESGYSTPCIAWATPPGLGGYPAIKTETPNFKLVYFGFGFEAIDNAADRDTVMARALNWLLSATSAEDPKAEIPVAFSLGQNFPNPFNPETTIPYVLPERAGVSLHVFNVLGREVATLNPGMQNAGAHEIRFDGARLSSGLYFYRLDAAAGANTFSATRKFMLLK